MLVATSGGHLTQLHLLRPRIVPHDEVLWVTDATAQSESMLAGQRVVELPNRAPRAYLGILRDYLRLCRVFRAERVDHVYSTGAQMALSAMLAAKTFGVPFSYIESGTRVRELSATGRVLARVPGIAPLRAVPVRRRPIAGATPSRYSRGFRSSPPTSGDRRRASS